MGTGCGIIALLALYKKKFARVYGIEIRESLFKLAQLNAERNGFLEQFQPVLNDFTKNYRDFAGIKTIFSNPPFFEPHRGRQSPNPEIRDAKTETSLTLKDLLLKSRDILPKDGSLFIIIPYHRFDDLTALTQKIDFFPHRVREVFSFADGKPGRFLIQLSSTNVPLQKMAPLIIFKEKGIYTEEMDKILTG
ncbi:MAG: methyltransferase [Acidobacteria bacterium]|nr:methyltransferase [Acidobacteriota bacterium]